MPRRGTGREVFDEALDRVIKLYEGGHRIVVSFSGGKDSGVCLELCVIAASITGRLPVEVIMRDEEIMFPGTFEYAERVAARLDIDFHWIYANQPVINVYNREQPYFWTFDPLIDPDEWVRKPPPIAYKIDDQNIEKMTIPDRFPLAEGKDLYAVIGLRASESRTRLMSIFSMKGCVSKANRFGTRNIHLIYDWKDGDVWRAIQENGWDYNSAYTVMHRLGTKKTNMRIAPPTLNVAGATSMQLAAKSWPRWFDRVSRRLPGVRLAAKYGKRAVQPLRKLNETWEQCFWRTCVNEAPEWIAERALKVMEICTNFHSHHSGEPFPDMSSCSRCMGKIRSWRILCNALYCGDPFSLNGISGLRYVEPEFFRPGSGTWDGTPGFA